MRRRTFLGLAGVLLAKPCCATQLLPALPIIPKGRDWLSVQGADGRYYHYQNATPRHIASLSWGWITLAWQPATKGTWSCYLWLQTSDNRIRTLQDWTFAGDEAECYRQALEAAIDARTHYGLDGQGNDVAK